MIRKLFAYTKNCRWLIVLGVLCSAAEAVFELLIPLVMKDLYDYGVEMQNMQVIIVKTEESALSSSSMSSIWSGG